MQASKTEWYSKWFNQDYLNLYDYHDQNEAKQQADFIMHHLNLCGKERILDLGCGTGRHALQFALKGMSIIGIDSSPALIRKAQNKQKEYPSLQLQFLLRDMRLPFQELGEFDLVVNLFTSFGYFSTDQENFSVLQNIRNVLPTEGKFFLDYLNPEFIKTTLINFEEREIKGEHVEIERKIEEDCIIKTIHFPNRSYQERVKMYSHEKMLEMLEFSGFTTTQCWGDFKGTPWSTSSERQLFYCRVIL